MNRMKTSGIPDAAVCWAYDQRAVCGITAEKILAAMYPDTPAKVLYAAMRRASVRGFVEYGVSLRAGWLTEAGKKVLSEAKP